MNNLENSYIQLSHHNHILDYYISIKHFLIHVYGTHKVLCFIVRVDGERVTTSPTEVDYLQVFFGISLREPTFSYFTFHFRKSARIAPQI
jgi:hypothetical protein